MRTWLTVIGVVLVGVGTSGAYFYHQNDDSEKPETKSRAAQRNGRKSNGRKTNGGAEGHVVTTSTNGHSNSAGETPPSTERTTTQPGSVIPDKSAMLFAKVSGYLKDFGEDLEGKPIDIGSRVKKGQVLAIIDMPELEKQVLRNKASLKRTKATVTQMNARVTTAKADAAAAEKMVEFRTKMYNRLLALANDKNAIDMRVVDEREEQMHAAEETKNAADARILQAEADVEEAEAEVELAQATLDQSIVEFEYSKIRSPYDGVITKRTMWPGEFVRAADHGANEPLLEVHKTDVVRVEVQIPDVDVPYVMPGNAALIKVFNLPGMEFKGVVARIAHAEDVVNRTMRIEIDLPNRDGRLHDGMYATVTVSLEKGDEAKIAETGDKE